jgi:HAD superfamily hydrolase (TIGR01509 family)
VSRPKAVLFDLDGVLVDSSRYHQIALERLGAELGVVVTESFHRATFGTRTRETLLRLLTPPPPDEELERLTVRKEALFREVARGNLVPLDGAVELVRALRTDGYRLAIGSSTVRANVLLTLEELGVLDAFDAIVAGEDVTVGKPEPEVFLKAAGKVDVPPSRCVVVEDAPQGVEAALRGGMRVVAVATSQPASRLADADRVVASLAELTPQDFDALLSEP